MVQWFNYCIGLMDQWFNVRPMMTTQGKYALDVKYAKSPSILRAVPCPAPGPISGPPGALRLSSFA